MNYPTIIYADTDLVCGEEPKDGHQQYIRVDASDESAIQRKLKSDAEIDSIIMAANNLVEIVEGVRNVEWSYQLGKSWRLKDTPEWCAFYCAWSKLR